MIESIFSSRLIVSARQVDDSDPTACGGRKHAAANQAESESGDRLWGRVEPTTVGVQQGSPLSPLYSNIYLNLLDQCLASVRLRRNWEPRCIALRISNF